MSARDSGNSQTAGDDVNGAHWVGTAARLPRWAGYAITLLLEVALTAGLLALMPHLPLAQFPIPYVLLIMLVAYTFGEGPAIMAFVVGFMAFDYYFVPPLYTLFPHTETRMGWAALTAFLLGTFIVGFATILMRRSRERIQRVVDELRESREDLNRAQSVARTGSWRLNVRRNELLWSDETYRMFEIPKGTPMAYDSFLAAVHPEDRECVDQAWQTALRGEPYDIEHRIVVGDTVKWVRERADLEFDARGALLGGFGTVQDITERKEAEQREHELEAHKLDFYRRTLQAATGGKLVITDRESIDKTAGPTVATWDIRRPEDLKAIRDGVAQLIRDAGVDESRLGKFQMCVGEAATNALKHAGGGVASLHRTDDSLIFVVSDTGPGIEAVTLPEVALTPGFSTAGTLGMGYKVMLSFADTVYLATGPEGTTVAVEMKLHPAGTEQ